LDKDASEKKHMYAQDSESKQFYTIEYETFDDGKG
jgi:hypothetical protein